MNIKDLCMVIPGDVARSLIDMEKNEAIRKLLDNICLVPRSYVSRHFPRVNIAVQFIQPAANDQYMMHFGWKEHVTGVTENDNHWTRLKYVRSPLIPSDVEGDNEAFIHGGYTAVVEHVCDELVQFSYVGTEGDLTLQDVSHNRIAMTKVYVDRSNVDICFQVTMDKGAWVESKRDWFVGDFRGTQQGLIEYLVKGTDEKSPVSA